MASLPGFRSVPTAAMEPTSLTMPRRYSVQNQKCRSQRPGNAEVKFWERAAFPRKGQIVSDPVAEPSESNSLELRIAFHNAVLRFQDWTAGVAEPKVKFRSLARAYR